MRIVADENIPFVHELFSTFGEVTTLPGREMTAGDVEEADILLVRSVTPVNESLLGQSKVQFVGTCTIGTDHLDTDFLVSRNISYASAAGCNAISVVQYVLSALAVLYENDTWLTKSVGIIGCGNVGGSLYRVFKSLNMDCLCFDPFLTTRQIADLTHWEAVLDADILCLHTPLTQNGAHPTYHMFNEKVLRSLKPGTLLLNAGRGAVIDNQALLKILEDGRDLSVVLDVWENEPHIDRQLQSHLKLGTPHIAGYSFEGRLRGSTQIFEALGQHLVYPDDQLMQHSDSVKASALGSEDSIYAESLNEAILTTYDVRNDHQRLKEFIGNKAHFGQYFDSLRKHYPKRHEFSNYRVQNARDPRLQGQLAALGFQC